MSMEAEFALMPRIAGLSARHSELRIMSISSRSSSGASRSAPGQRPSTSSRAWRRSAPARSRRVGRGEVASGPFLIGRSAWRAHQGTPDAQAACRRKGLEMADGAPVSYDWARITMKVHLADQRIAGPRDAQPTAVRAEAREDHPATAARRASAQASVSACPS